MTEHACSVKAEWSRLERDLQEGSRRLAMAHSEIRRLTDELESAHLTQRAYGASDNIVLMVTICFKPPDSEPDQ